jgi:hypothetical protein
MPAHAHVSTCAFASAQRNINARARMLANPQRVQATACRAQTHSWSRKHTNAPACLRAHAPNPANPTRMQTDVQSHICAHARSHAHSRARLDAAERARIRVCPCWYGLHCIHALICVGMRMRCYVFACVPHWCAYLPIRTSAHPRIRASMCRRVAVSPCLRACFVRLCTCVYVLRACDT